MKPEDSQQSYLIFQSALDLAADERAAYLDEACAGDAELRGELESLLSSYEEAGSFIETPAIEVDASVVAAPLMNSIVGQSIGHYQIIRPLGAGGMGEVYLASDTRTDRKVALKLLPDYLTQSNDRVRRFQQEARTALTLNHPNIVTIYEIGEVDGRYFIASEWIQGETLRQRLSDRSLQLSEVLDITIQVASALTEAHQQGIVHRDIKPENIMLRPDGYVKVLDFGIAKLTELQTPVVASEAPTALKVKTAPGMVMGTANYMSPEQTRGLTVDQRTDTWSLGVVLYEMVAGCAPFAGETAGDVIAAILEKQPAPLARYSREAPEALEEIVTTALAKNRDERYQTATQMTAALRRLKQRLDVAAELERSMPPHNGGAVAVTRSSQETTAEVTSNAAAQTGQPASVHRASSAEFIVGEIKRHRWGAAVIFSLLALAIAAIGYGLYRFVSQKKAAAPFQTMKIARLTAIGKVSDASISPDGKYVAYAMDEGGQQSLWLRQVAVPSSNHQIGPPAMVRYLRMTFSPDGNYLYYFQQQKNSIAIYRVPVLGGPPRKLLDSANDLLTFSPDGKQFAFVRSRSVRESSLMIADADGTGERQLASGQLIRPAWSPDGKVIACANIDLTNGVVTTIIGVRVADGAQSPITSQQWFQIGELKWLGDGSGLVLVGREHLYELGQIWHVSYPSGEVRRVTNDLKDYCHVSVTADSGALATVQNEQVSNIWVAPGGDASRVRQITSETGKQEGTSAISWTPDGKIVYVSMASGRPSIWITEADGTGQRQITDDTYDAARPAVSPDGRYIVFSSYRAGSSKIWRIDVAGGNLKQLTSGGFDAQPYCSPDGRWVVYTSFSSGAHLWKVPIDGGGAVPLSKAQARGAIVSPDGKLMACWYFEGDGPNLRMNIAIIPFEGGDPIKVFDLPPTAYPPAFSPTSNYLRWTSDSSAVLYIDTRGGASNIWSWPIAGGAPKQLTDFKTDRIFSFDWTGDGKQLAMARGTETSDVVLISNFK